MDILCLFVTLDTRAVVLCQGGFHCQTDIALVLAAPGNRIDLKSQH